MSSITPFNPSFTRERIQLILDDHEEVQDVQIGLEETEQEQTIEIDSDDGDVLIDDNVYHIFNRNYLIQDSYSKIFLRKELDRRGKVRKKKNRGSHLRILERPKAITGDERLDRFLRDSHKQISNISGQLLGHYTPGTVLNEISTIFTTRRYVEISPQSMYAALCPELEGRTLCRLLARLDRREALRIQCDNTHDEECPKDGYSVMAKGTGVATGIHIACSVAKKRGGVLGVIGLIGIGVGGLIAREGIHRKASELQLQEMVYKNRLRRLAEKINDIYGELRGEELEPEDREQYQIAIRYFFAHYEDAIERQEQFERDRSMLPLNR